MTGSTNKKKCFIFGAGYAGSFWFSKIKLTFDVIGYTDNNQALWGSMKNGLPVVAVNEMLASAKEINACVLICSFRYYSDIAAQLDSLGFANYYIVLDSFLYEYQKGVLYPHTLELGGVPRFEDLKAITRRAELAEQSRKSEGDFSVLFVQYFTCTRTEKIASVLKSKEVKTFLAYTLSPSRSGKLSFCEEYGFWSAHELINFANTGDFDVVHCSNEPDILSNLLITSNKTVIHDMHDMTSIRSDVDENTRVLEYLANTQADGVMYTTEAVREIAERKFKIPSEKIYVLNNLPLGAYKVDKRTRKLSCDDGKVHTVYEGGISPLLDSHRFFEDIWEKITSQGVHIHFYSHQNVEYCKQLADTSEFLHYEGDFHASELANEMTKYDVGLLYLNVHDKNRVFIETTSPNKMTEYLNSGLPVAVGNVNSQIKFVKTHNCGDFLDLDGDIVSQLRAISAIRIADDFLETNGLTMNSKIDEILDFYRKIAAK